MTRRYIVPGVERKRRAPEPLPFFQKAPVEKRNENHHISTTTETVENGWQVTRAVHQSRNLYDGISSTNFQESVTKSRNGLTKYFNRSYDRNGEQVTVSGNKGYTRVLPASDSISAEAWLDEPEADAALEDGNDVYPASEVFEEDENEVLDEDGYPPGWDHRYDEGSEYEGGYYSPEATTQREAQANGYDPEVEDEE